MAFTPRVKIVLLAASILAFLLAALLVVLPSVLVNRPDIRAALQERLGAMLGGEVGFDRLTLTLIPRVSAAAANPRLELPGKVSARAAEIDVSLKLLPLLLGRVMADSITVSSPEIHLPAGPIDSAGRSRGFTDPRLLLARTADLVKQIPESSIEIKDGRLVLAGSDGQRLEFLNLDLRFGRGGERMEWSLSGKSGVSKAFSSSGRLETDSFKGMARLQADGFNPQVLQSFFMPDSPFQVLDSHLNLDVSIALEGPSRVAATVAGKAPVVAFGYKNRNIGLNVDRIDARLMLSEKRLSVSISEFLSLAPRAALQFTLARDETRHPRIGIELQGNGDLSGVREVALALLNEIPDAMLVCDILRAGETPEIQVKMHGDTWDELTDLENLQISGRLDNASVYLPWIDLGLDEVSGEAKIAGGVLEGRGLRANYKGSRAEDGILRVGLSSDNPILRLDVQARAELSDLPPLLARIIPDPAFRKEIERIEEFSGTAKGNLTLDGTHEDVAVEVRASELDVRARHRLIDYPLRFQGGEFSYDANAITLDGVDVSIGRSKLFKHQMTLGLKEGLPLESGSPQAVVDLAEIFSLFRDRPPFNHLSRLDGTATFTDWRLNGLARDPSTWTLVSAGTLQDFFVESELLPGKLGVSSAKFDWLGRTIRYQSTKASVNRSAIRGLSVDADWAGPARLELRASGIDLSIEDFSAVLESLVKPAAGAAALFPLSGQARIQDVRFQSRLLPEGLTFDKLEAKLEQAVIQSALTDLPLSLTSGSISWRGSQMDVRTAKATLGTSEISHLAVSDYMGSDRGLELRSRSAAINCSEIYPRLSALPGFKRLRDDVADVQGTVTFSDVIINGPGRDSDRWRVKAALDLKDIAIATTFLDGPVGIPSGRLTASSSQSGKSDTTAFNLEAIRLSHGPHGVTVSGEAALSRDETLLDLKVAADDLDWSEIEKIADRIAKHSRGDSRPVHGRVGLRAERFVYDRFRSTPLYAVTEFGSRATTVLIERAGFCGMTLIGRVSLDGPMVDALLVPVVNALPLENVITCLTNQKHLSTGSLNLDGSLEVRARREEIVDALKGRLSLVAEDGTILRSVLFAKLFALLNLTEIYRGQFPDLDSQGLDFKRMKASMEIKDGKVLVHDWSIDGRTLWMGSRGEIDIATQKIDFTIMVSPFKTIDRIVNSIPGVRWILGGRLVAIPMRATGDLANPDVVALSPSAVGTSILEMLQRTLTLPIEIIQPLVPGVKIQEADTIKR